VRTPFQKISIRAFSSGMSIREPSLYVNENGGNMGGEVQMLEETNRRGVFLKSMPLWPSTTADETISNYFASTGWRGNNRRFGMGVLADCGGPFP
jgi:hypothetical protein